MPFIRILKVGLPLDLKCLQLDDLRYWDILKNHNPPATAMSHDELADVLEKNVKVSHKNA